MLERHDAALKAESLNTERRWLTLARSYGFTESLEDFTAVNSERRRKFDERVQHSSVPLAEVRKNLDGPDNVIQLHEISTLLIQENNLDSHRILDAAMSLMSSDAASLQLFDPERNQLQLIAWKGFHPQSALLGQLSSSARSRRRRFRLFRALMSSALI
jgi:hypothetical protein